MSCCLVVRRVRSEPGGCASPSQQCVWGSAAVPAALLRRSASTVTLISRDQEVCLYFVLSNKPSSKLADERKKHPFSLPTFVQCGLDSPGLLVCRSRWGRLTLLHSVSGGLAGTPAGPPCLCVVSGSLPGALARRSPRAAPCFGASQNPGMTGLLGLGPEPSFAALTFRWLKPSTGLVPIQGRGCPGAAAAAPSARFPVLVSPTGRSQLSAA